MNIKFVAIDHSMATENSRKYAGITPVASAAQFDVNTENNQASAYYSVIVPMEVASAIDETDASDPMTSVEFGEASSTGIQSNAEDGHDQQTTSSNSGGGSSSLFCVLFLLGLFFRTPLHSFGFKA